MAKENRINAGAFKKWHATKSILHLTTKLVFENQPYGSDIY